LAGPADDVVLRTVPCLFDIGISSDLVDTSRLRIAPSAARVTVAEGLVPRLHLTAADDLVGDDFVYRREEERYLLRWHDAAFAVATDRVDIDAEDPRAAIEVYLIPVWSFVLAIHRRASLHGSVVARGGRAVAILGDSGAGKSTIAARAVAAGWDLVADDLVAWQTSGEVSAGSGYVRLLGDAAPDAGTDDTADAGGKIRLPASLARSATLAGVIVMEPRFDRLVRLSGVAALDAVLANRYIPFALDAEHRKRDLDSVTGIVRSVPVYGAPPRSLTVANLERVLDGS